jgi:hypothetical protein
VVPDLGHRDASFIVGVRIPDLAILIEISDVLSPLGS